MVDGSDIGLQTMAHSAQNHAQSATCTIFAATQSINPRWSGDMGRGRYDLSPDVVQCSVQETFQGQQCDFTLVPRKPYREILFPGDWISVYFSTNSASPSGFGVAGREDQRGDNDRVMVGVIDAVRQSITVDESTGNTQVRISVSASGINKIFDKTSIYYNEHLGPQTQFGGLLPGLSTLTKNVPLIGTPATMPRTLALTYLGFGGQFLLPESYPQPQGTNRSTLLQGALARSLDIERQLGFLKVRLGAAGAVQRAGLSQRLFERQQELLTPQSAVALMDLFGHVEDLFVDGRVQNNVASDLTGSVWNMMVENCNPIMNEIFITMLPAGVDELHSDQDEWGQSPAYVPALVLRERPFSWVDHTFDVPAFVGKKRHRQIRFGNVFFSSIDKPATVPHLQLPENAAFAIRNRGIDLEDGSDESFKVLARWISGVSASELKTIKKDTDKRNVDFLSYLVSAGLLTNAAVQTIINPPTLQSFQGTRFMYRVKVRPQDIRNETLGTSDNDLYNFHMISQANQTLAHQKYVLIKDGLIPIYLTESIRRYGLRVRDLTTKFAYLGGSQVGGKQAQDILIRCLLAQDLWYQHQPYYLAGTISTPGMPKAHVGMALDVGGHRQETFYIEGIGHEWSHPGRLETTFTVTRGQPSEEDKRFPYAAPSAVKVYREIAPGRTVELPRFEADEQPTVKKPLLDLNNDAAMAKALGFVPEDYANFKRQAQRKAENPLIFARDEGLIDQKRYEVLQQQATQKRDVAPEQPVMEDRLNAGRPPWVDNAGTRGAMFDPIRRVDLKRSAVYDVWKGKG